MHRSGRVALRSGIDTTAPRMLTRKEAAALPAGEVSWVGWSA